VAKKFRICAQNENLYWYSLCQKLQKIRQLLLIFSPKFDFCRGLAFVRAANSFGTFTWVMGMFWHLPALVTNKC
jgi:hypothetical protein